MEEKIKKECIDRIEMLIDQGVLTDIDILGLFEKGELCVSEANMLFGSPCGVIFNLKDKKRYYEIFKNKVENEIYGKAYFIMVQNTSFGMMMSVLYVPNFEEDWELNKADLEERSPYAYIYNFDEDYGEAGYIRYDIFNGGPIRTA